MQRRLPRDFVGIEISLGSVDPITLGEQFFEESDSHIASTAEQTAHAIAATIYSLAACVVVVNVEPLLMRNS